MTARRLRETGLLAMGLVGVSLLFAGPAARGQNLDSDEWQLSVTPYMWFSGIEGDVRIRENESDVDVGFDDIWDAFDFGAQVHIEAQKGRWGLLVDSSFLALSVADEELEAVEARLETDMWLVEFGGFYRLGDWPGDRGFRGSLDVLAGGRFWDMETELSIGPLRRESDTSWVDPFVGLRLMAQLTDRFSLILRGDVGGFSIYEDASELTWNVFAGPAVKLSKHTAVVAGYRALNIDREEGNNFAADLTFAGPEIGLYIQF